MANRPQPAPPRSRAAERGFSIVEALIAAALLLLVVIGVLPLFERARLNLLQGNDATRVTGAALDAEDRLFALPFNSGDTLLLGAATTRTATDFFLASRRVGDAENGERWVTAVSAPDLAQFTRTVMIDQFQISALDDGQLTDDERQPGDALPNFVQLRRYTVQVTNARTLGGAPPYVVAAHRSF